MSLATSARVKRSIESVVQVSCDAGRRHSDVCCLCVTRNRHFFNTYLSSCKLWYATECLESDSGSNRRRHTRVCREVHLCLLEQLPDAGFSLWPLHLHTPPPPTSVHPRMVLPVSTHRYTHIRPEVLGWAPRCDLAPQSTSFGTLALRERQHLALAGSGHLHDPPYATT